MSKTKLILKTVTVLAVVFLPLVSIGQHQCTWHDTYAGGKTGDPYIENDCFAPIDRYLARTLYMTNLVSVNVQSNWGDPCDNHGDWQNPNPGEGCYFNPSIFGYDCNGYCPERYWCDIDLCAELNAAMIYDVASLWGGETGLIPNSNEDYWYKMQDAVKDIWKAYDELGLQRPIIGATVFEYISDYVNGVPIPDYVTNAFTDEMTSDEITLYQCCFTTFNITRISQPPIQPWPNYPTTDLNKLEGRMWFYYCATQYIDAGYTLLNLGALGEVECLHDVNNIKTYNLFSKIRDYAVIKGTPLLICGGSPENLFYNNTNTLLTDFYLEPIRPQESTYNSCLSTHLVSGQNNSLINHYSPGWNSFGCYETPHALYSITYDNTGGVLSTPGSTNPSDYSEDYIIWGYDESRWFYQSNLESDGCAEDQLDNFMCGNSGVRSLADDTRGYIQVPGRTNVQATQDEIDAGENLGRYRLYDHPNVKDKVKNDIWNPNDNTYISTSIAVNCQYFDEDCDADHFKGNNTYTYTFSVPNPDCSTVYTWHLKKPDGSWEPFTYGTSRTYSPPVTGTYMVSLRQDNLGYAPSTFGTIQHDFYFTVLLGGICCVYHDWQKESENDSVFTLEKGFLKVYPNPTNGKFTISFGLLEKLPVQKVNLEIKNVVGRQVYQEYLSITNGILNKDYDFGNSLSEGIYIVDVISDNSTLETKFLYQK